MLFNGRVSSSFRSLVVSVLATIAPLALVACSTTTASTGAPTAFAGTVAGVGEMPGDIGLPVDRDAPLADPAPEETAPVATEPEPEPMVLDSDGIRPGDLGLATFGEMVDGNRVIVIGDSIMASTAERYGGDMCNRLNEAGWDVEVDAEPGRFIDFAHRVLNRRLPPSDGADWDAAVILFGSNFRGDYLNFEDQMLELIERLAPRPVLVLTVSEFTETRTVVNDIIRSIADGDPNVYLLDWADMTDAEPRLVGGDGIHLTGAGRTRIVAEVALALGEAPGRLEGECLPTAFTDDVLPTIVTE